MGFEDIDQLQIELDRIEKGFTTWKIEFKFWDLIDKATRKIIGYCDYHFWYVEHERAEMGYALLNNAYKNKGIMPEAMAAVLDYGFREMGLNRVEAFIGLDNVSSRKLVEKFDFTQEGILREHYKNNGVIEDSVAYALLKSEYKA